MDFKFIFNLQLFAEGEEGKGDPSEGGEGGKPPATDPEPTKEELQAQALSKLENEYNVQKEGFKKDLDTATLAGNTEAVQSIQKEFMEFNKAYEEAKNNILEEGVE